MKIGVVLSLLILTRFCGISQNNTLSTSISFSRFDFFYSFEYEYQPQKLGFNVGVGYGINRTIFQQRFYPRISMGSTYYWLNNERFQIGPSLNYAFSFIRLTSSSKVNLWNELNVGLTWAYGRKWKVGQSILVGYVNESHYSTFENQRVNAATLGYFVSIKLLYEI